MKRNHKSKNSTVVKKFNEKLFRYTMFGDTYSNLY